MGGCCLRKLKIELAAFQDPLGGAEEEDFILQDWSAKLRAGIPTQAETEPGRSKTLAESDESNL